MSERLVSQGASRPPPEAVPSEPMNNLPVARTLRNVVLAACILIFACASSASPLSSRGFLIPPSGALEYREGVVIAKPKAAARDSVGVAERGEGLVLRARYDRLGGLRVIQLAAGDTVPAAIARLMSTGRYEFVEPDYVRKTQATVPNDKNFGSQWGLKNSGANGGIAGADINAEAGWDIQKTAPDVVVGMLDSGALLTHEDLSANLWKNPNPGTTVSLASVDSSTGAADTVSETDSANGLNGLTKSGTPSDDEGHGTLTSGVVGAVGNNTLGISGVAWQVQLMELAFLDKTGSGSISNELPCI